MRPGASVVGLSLRVNSEGRPMTHFLTTIVSDLRLRQIMTELGGSRRDAHRCVRPRPCSLSLRQRPGAFFHTNRTLQNAARLRLAGARPGASSSRACSTASTNAATRFSSGLSPLGHDGLDVRDGDPGGRNQRPACRRGPANCRGPRWSPSRSAA